MMKYLSVVIKTKITNGKYFFIAQYIVSKGGTLTNPYTSFVSKTNYANNSICVVI